MSEVLIETLEEVRVADEGLGYVTVLDLEGNPLEYNLTLLEAHDTYGIEHPDCLACGEPFLHSFESLA